MLMVSCVWFAIIHNQGNAIMTTHSNPAKKRKIILINKSFQMKFIASVLATIILFALCSAGLLYWLISGDLESQSQAAHFNINNAWERLGISILIGNVVAAIIAGIMAIYVVLYISHKIVGPLYRFETICKKVAEGDLNTITRLRPNDQLQELADSFSSMVDKLRDKKVEKDTLTLELNSHIEKLKQEVNYTEEQLISIKKIELLLVSIKSL